MARGKKGFGRGRKKSRKFGTLFLPFVLVLALVFWIFLSEQKPESGKKKRTGSAALSRVPPRLALIIDDGGYHLDHFRAMLSLGKPITFAILPHAPHTREAGRLAREKKMEVILHLPMEPKEKDGNSLEKNTIHSEMADAEIRAIVKNALHRVPHARGVNNHMGSKATENPRIMQILMETLKGQGLYFVDSHTSPQTMGPRKARKAGVAYGLNALFIDQSTEPAAIKEAIRRAMGEARTAGKAIAIGHPLASTVKAVREMIPEIEQEGIRMVFASEVVR